MTSARDDSDRNGSSGGEVDTARSARALRSRLGRIAGDHSHAALDAYRRETYETFYVEAGIALELAMKTKLAAVTPYLLAPDGHKWFQHGHQFAKGVTAAKGLKSVSADHALQRLQAIEPILMTGIATKIQATVDRRDQSVHMGVFAKPSDDELLSHAAAFVEAVNGLILREPDEFWCELAGLAAELVAAERDVVRVRVERKLATARALFTALADDQRATLSENGLVYFEHYKDEEPELVLVTCPVCNNNGLGTGELTDDGEPDWDPHEPGPVGWNYDINTVLTGFECKVCQLELDGADEIAAADLPEKVENDHADPSLLYEPDWDRD